MNSIKNLIKKIQSPVWIGIFVLFVSIIVIIFASKVLYIRTVDLLTVNLRERILTISITAATGIDASDLSALHNKEDWQKPEWARIVNKLHKVKYSNNDIVFMYIFRKKTNDPNQMEFVGDADSINPYDQVDVNRDGKIEAEGPDKLQWPGQPYPEAAEIPEAFKAYDGPLTSTNLYTDEYGTVLTGYAPIKDDDGNTIAILATDIKADDFFTITTQTLRPFLIFIIFLTFTISILTVVLIYAWRRYASFLEKSNNDKSEFISFASHQIRTPLTSIKGFTSNLLEGDYGEINAAARDAIQKVLVRSNDVVSLIGQYLDKSKMELGELKYDFKEFNLTALTSQVVNELVPTAEQAKVNLSFNSIETPPFIIMADQGKIKEVISNLVDNSIKYTPIGSVIIVLAQKQDKVVLKISDTGVGMNKATTRDLFKKFGRGKDAAKTNILGSGLGLYLAKVFVEAHNGKLWAESEGEGKGSTFFVELSLK